MEDQAHDVQKEFFEWDDAVTGLGLRHRRNQRPVWCVQLRHDGHTRRRMLGHKDALSLEDARDAARDLIRELTGDGSSKKSALPKDATIAACAEAYLKHGAAIWKPTTLRTHRYLAARYIHPEFGHLPAASIDPEHVAQWRSGIGKSHETASRALAVLSGIMRHAELLGVCEAGSNPCQGLRRRKNGFKAQRLTAEDYARLGKAIRWLQQHHLVIANLIRFIAFTGCRKSEARLLKWDMIDGRRAALPDSKTGPRALWLGQPALRVIAEQPRLADYVFAVGGEPVKESKLDWEWRNVRAKAKLKTLRLHDLRHGFASVAITSGEPLRTVSGLLGHTELKTTAGYVAIDEGPVLAAAERVAQYLTKAMSAKPDH